ncbi:hypothetical protein [Streptosporangium canum]|uniref:hypothetical protein n=1 Tax=Streptosporangium canum TaxID=324952 RepID=UPI0034386CA0
MRSIEVIGTEMNDRQTLVSDTNGVKVTKTETDEGILWEVVPDGTPCPEAVQEAMKLLPNRPPSMVVEVGEGFVYAYRLEAGE